MGDVIFPFSLIAGQPENVNQLNANLDAIKTVVDSEIDATNLASNAVTTAKITDLNVTTAKLAANAVTAAKIEAQQAWQTIALTGITGNLSYYKDSLGTVHFRGDTLTGNSGGAGSTLCTMPSGYRPAVKIYQPLIITNSTGSVTISIDTDGTVKTISALTTSPWSFGAVHYRADGS